ncbi:MAG: cyclic nucleotide-binding domain-containing protein [Magnetococcales bacterium]|nr:cyclic nucleotide-binding domain-containing protein [Magnetococcales bacterium]
MNAATLTILKRTTLFAGLDEASLATLSDFCEIQDFQDGQKAISENNDVGRQDLFLLIGGSVSVGAKFVPLETAAEASLQGIDNELYGEIAFLLSTKRSAGITCKGRTRFLKINGEKLNAFMLDNPTIGFLLMDRIAKVLAQRVIKLTDQLKSQKMFDF